MVTGRPIPTNHLPGTRVEYITGLGSCSFRSNPTPSGTKGDPVHMLPHSCNGPSLRPEDAHNRLPWKDRCPQRPWKQAMHSVSRGFQSPESQEHGLDGCDPSLALELRAGPEQGQLKPGTQWTSLRAILLTSGEGYRLSPGA